MPTLAEIINQQNTLQIPVACQDCGRYQGNSGEQAPLRPALTLDSNQEDLILDALECVCLNTFHMSSGKNPGFYLWPRD